MLQLGDSGSKKATGLYPNPCLLLNSAQIIPVATATFNESAPKQKLSGIIIR